MTGTEKAHYTESEAKGAAKTSNSSLSAYRGTVRLELRSKSNALRSKL